MSDHGACALVGCPLCSPRNFDYWTLTPPTITVSSGTPKLKIGRRACPACNGAGWVNPGGWSYPRTRCTMCFGTGATFDRTPVPQPEPEPPSQEKPKKMNWPIAIYSQNGELPIKFAIEREEPFRFSIRLINQLSEGWWVSVWFDGHEIRGVRTETLEQAESEARDSIVELVSLFESVANSIGVPLDSRG